MGAILKVESDEAVRLAAELAEMTGQSIENAVKAALRARLEHERMVRARAAGIMAAAAEIRSHMRKPLPTSNHDWLYGEDGLPT
jgi:hypothetical protein